jgi:hypothetical protein
MGFPLVTGKLDPGRRCSEMGHRSLVLSQWAWLAAEPNSGAASGGSIALSTAPHWHNPCAPGIDAIYEREWPVKFVIEIGDTEKHQLEYSFNQLLGSLVIKVNEKAIKKSVRLINEPVLEIYAFVVGDHEKSDVRIEKERKPLLGCKNRVYVNNRLVNVFSGN